MPQEWGHAEMTRWMDGETRDEEAGEREMGDGGDGEMGDGGLCCEQANCRSELISACAEKA